MLIRVRLNLISSPSPRNNPVNLMLVVIVVNSCYESEHHERWKYTGN